MAWDLKNQEVTLSNMWAIINKKGAMNQKHHHSNSDISAAYYVSAHDGCGDIVFYDPRPAKVYKHPIAKEANILILWFKKFKYYGSYIYRGGEELDKSNVDWWIISYINILW